jgi:hypothetical protein
MAGSPNFLATLGENVKRRAIWLVVAIAVSGAAYGAKTVFHMFSKSEEPVVASVQAAPRPKAPAPAPVAFGPATEQQAAAAANAAATANAAAAKPNVPANASAAKPGAVANAAAAKPGATKADAAVASRPVANASAASGEGAGAPVVTAVPQPSQAPGSGLAHLDEHLTYQYNALGRRDPFQSLVEGDFVGADVGGDAPPDPGGIRVVGIVWGSTDQFALVEDVRGNSFVLRKGDKVQNGYVEGLKRDALIVTITSEGQTQSVAIPLVRKGDQNAR